MKICILSMQMIDNFGSVLQAYNLKKMVNELGHDVKFINIKNGDMKDNISTEESTKPLTRTSKLDKYIFNKMLIKLKEKEQIKKYEEFRTDFLGIGRSDDDENYDLCIIGSDEVFNCVQKSPWGLSEQLFGKVENAKRVITYAASCSSTEYNNLTNKAKQVIRESLNNIEAFSARDNNTYEFLKCFEKENINSHLDPVLVGNIDEEINEAEKKIIVPDDICVIYSYKNRMCSETEINAIKEFCRRNRLKPVTIGGSQKWIKDALVLSPFEALAYIKNARFIITDTFHGTIFSAKYNGNFATIYRESNFNKLSDLAKKLKIEDHIVSNLNEVQEIFDRKNSNDNVVKILNSEREKSIEYLKNSINS